MIYIDVRSVWPVLFMGMKAYELVGAPKDITVEEAVASISPAV